MGAKVHYKNYLPRYYSMRDINEDANSSWPRYYEGRAVNGQFCNGFTPRLSNGYSDYDKEALKQTILRHEEIFRKQVFELHHLYRKQRDLMEELKRNREQNFSMQVKSSLSSPFSTPMFPKGMDKLWQVHGFASTTAGCSRTPMSAGDDSQNRLNSLNGSSFKAGSVSKENGSSQVDQLPDFGVRKVPIKMLDLELPADAYIDIEEEHAEEKKVVEPPFGHMDTSERNSSLQPVNNVKTLCAAQDPCSSWKSSSYLQNDQPACNLADLNEPLRDVNCEEMSTSSSKFPIQVTYAQDFQRHQKFRESASCFIDLENDLFQDRSNGGGDGPVVLHMERGEKGREQPFFSSEIRKLSSDANAFNSSLSSKNVNPLFEPAQVKPEKAQDFPFFSPKQGGTHSWFREKQSRSMELSDRNYHITDKMYYGLTVPTTPSLFHALHLKDCAKTAPPMASSWRKPSNSISQQSVEVDAFPCFRGSKSVNSQSTSSHNLGNACETWQCSRDYMSTLNSGGETHWYPNGFHHGFQTESSASSSLHFLPMSINKPKLNNGACTYEKSECHGHQMPLNGLHCMEVKTANGVNLNLAPSNGLRNGLIPKAKMLCDVEREKDSLSGGISWLRTKSLCNTSLITDIRNEFASMDGHSQPTSSSCTSAWGVEQKKEAEASSSFEVLQDPPPVLKPKGTRIQQNEVGASSSNKINPHFSVPQGAQQSDTSFAPDMHPEIPLLDDHVKNKTKERFLHADPSCQSKLPDLGEQVHMERVPEKATAEAVHCFRAHINLNSTAASTDQSSSPERTNPPSPIFVQATSQRFTTEIDLEDPPSTSLAEEQTLSPAPAPQVNHLQPVEPESREQALQSSQTLEDALARAAAETIHMISLDRNVHLEDAASNPGPPSSAATLHTLHWFADVVTSNGDDQENVEALGCGGSSDINGMDYFEYMTLRLKEAQVDEYCCGPMVRQGPTTEDETGVVHLLLGRPRWGQAPGRRRRQRRDFQGDILPGLVSLSRHEVTEDLQVIGGLVRASGRPSNVAGGGRRNAGSNRPRRQVRGGQRRRRWRRSTSGGATAAAVETVADPQLGELGREEGEVEGRGMLEWGRTTKRCRRRRCPPGDAIVRPPS